MLSSAEDLISLGLPFPQPACSPAHSSLVPPLSAVQGTVCNRLVPVIIVGLISTTSLVEVEF